MDNNLTKEVEAFSHSDGFVRLHDYIFQWGVARNITAEGGATALSQIKKLKEEVEELEAALLVNDEEAVRDAIGDVQVVLFQVCRLRGHDLVSCLWDSWNEIKDRKGKMVSGVFVKE